MFNNLPKLTGTLTRENPMQQILFYFSRSTGSIKNFSIKNRQNKKFPRDKFVMKKEHFAKHVTVHKMLVVFLELSMFIHVYLP